jgi:hypothetical protein
VCRSRSSMNRRGQRKCRKCVVSEMHGSNDMKTTDDDL